MPTPAARFRAFSLIEITVTLVLLGVIAAAATVSWSRVVHGTDADAASALLDRVTVREQAFARDWGAYTSWPTDLADLGSDVVVLNAAPSPAADRVSVAVGTGGSLGLAVRVDESTCVFRLVDPLSAGGAARVPDVAADVPCTGQMALPADEDLVAQTGPDARTSL